MKIPESNNRKIPFPISPSINCQIAAAIINPAKTNLIFLLNIMISIFQAAKVIKTIKNYFNLVFAVLKKLCIFARSFKDRQNEFTEDKRYSQ